MTKTPPFLTQRFFGTPRTWSHFRVFKICEKQQQRHQGVKRSDMDDEATINTAETLETMTIHLLSGNQGLP